MGQEQITKSTDITGQKQGKSGPPEEFRWKKGESGNPAGRPPGSVSITAEIKKQLQEVNEQLQKTHLELLVRRILTQAINDGNEQIIKHIWSYIDGPPGPVENQDPAKPVMNIIMNKNSVEVRGESSERISA